MHTVQDLDISHAMQLAVLDQKLMLEEGGDNDKTLVQLDIRIKNWLSDGCEAVGVIDAGLVVAFCLYRLDADACLVKKLYVMEDERRRGLATRLLDTVAERAQGLPIQLHVASGNETAFAFYEHYGFTEWYRTLIK